MSTAEVEHVPDQGNTNINNNNIINNSDNTNNITNNNNTNNVTNNNINNNNNNNNLLSNIKNTLEFIVNHLSALIVLASIVYSILWTLIQMTLTHWIWMMTLVFTVMLIYQLLCIIGYYKLGGNGLFFLYSGGGGVGGVSSSGRQQQHQHGWLGSSTNSSTSTTHRMHASRHPQHLSRLTQMFNIPLSLQLTLMDRDFNSNDYEMLLALDDNNQNYGAAKKEQIESLPVNHLVGQKELDELNGATKSGDAPVECSICLSGFEVGERLKTLPCQHHYHSDCIDNWLIIKGMCPVCKSDVFVSNNSNSSDNNGNGPNDNNGSKSSSS
ncbi:hypothetical protein SAMD00019534_066920 [Acytostelium subglobosum LB1]|uniref:hypothetical protein n=1 Tax=Acytostelium subglobosum LB1 TaxID=1410327 RepID=UPI0006451BA3|nr:hypothetical protein SAMD00019534_066920 [Acytostelium subglobosum LB1]GAM23517.1 hypothetical protein SAMD00019534_066920 [Acytostelium subglobosum LB1]|eukprot:XP_012753258.1 hypothetical protein SAMD00019534_066920 [Acytostelium subglobosum LB1]